MLSFITFLCLISLAVSLECYTKTCIQNINTSTQFYDNRTFGFNIHPSPFKRSNNVDRLNNNYKDFINTKLSCDGQWCNENKFKCGMINGEKGRNCYEVHYIIDRYYKDYQIPDRCLNCAYITGNLVLVWGKWNAALIANSPFHYYNIQKEKQLIFGVENVRRAAQAILKCCEADVNGWNDNMAGYFADNSTDNSTCNSDTCNPSQDDCECEPDEMNQSSGIDILWLIIMNSVIISVILAIFIFHQCRLIIKDWIKNKEKHIELTDQLNG